MDWAELLRILPTAACLFWTLFYIMGAFRTSTFRVTTVLLFDLGAYLIAPKSTLALISGPCILPLAMHYLDRIRLDEHPQFYKILWLVFPTVLFTLGIILDQFALPDKYMEYKEKLRSFYLIVLMVEVFVFYGYLLFHVIRDGYRPVSRLFGFLFRHRTIRLVELQYFITGFAPIPFLWMALPKLDPYDTPVIPLIFALDVFAFAYVALMGTRKDITLKDLHIITRYNYGNKNKDKIVESMIADLLPDANPDTLNRIRKWIDERVPLETRENVSLSTLVSSSVNDYWGADPLFRRFQTEVIEKQLFLQPSLSLQEVAQVLGTNKTYVSKLVNKAYNLGFPELLNILRVDYAQQYLLTHRNAKQTEVATACGFLSASSFNIIFKKITGLPPKLWVASNNR